MNARKYKMIKGYNLAGTSDTRERVKNDYYATPEWATEAILRVLPLSGSILEPAAGEGHIAKVVKQRYPDCELVCTDLVQREEKFGIPIKGGIDFLTYDYGRKFDNIITNPPFKYAQEFIEKAQDIADDKVLMLAKIQLLEGKKRKALFDSGALRYIYVFRERVSPLRNGDPCDENGKPWASTMCLAWFVFDKKYKGEPVIRWLEKNASLC